MLAGAGMPAMTTGRPAVLGFASRATIRAKGSFDRDGSQNAAWANVRGLMAMRSAGVPPG